MVIIDLIYNLALLIALSIVSGFIGKKSSLKTQHALLQGLLFGIATIVGMLRPLEIAQGLFFDGRSVMISLCGLFFGPLAVTVTSFMTIALRIIQGGIGTTTGVCVILSSALIGLIFHYHHHGKPHEHRGQQLWIFGVYVHICMLLLMFTLPFSMAINTLVQIGLPVIITYPLATILVGKILSDQLSRDQLLSSISESREEFRTTLYSIGDAVITTDHQGRIRQMNKVAEALTDWSLTDAINRPLSEVFVVINEETRAAVEDPVARVLHENRVVGLANHTVLVSKNGSECAIADSGAPITNEAGEVTGVVLVFHDQTKERLTQLEISQSERKFRALFENMAAGGCTNEVIYEDGVAVDYRILDINPAFERITGLDRKDVVGRLASEVYRTNHIPYFKEFTEVATTGKPAFIEGYFEPFAKHVQITVGCPKPDHFSNVFLDITERKKAEEQLRKIEWMLTKKPQFSNTGVASPYCNVPEKTGLIVQTVDQLSLKNMVSDFLDLLGTSAYIYEENGECVLCTLASDWCRLLDTSRNSCHLCTSDYARTAIQTGAPVEGSCCGGLSIYCVPIMAGNKPIGAISFGYGDPPTEPEALRQIAYQSGATTDDLRRAAASYDTRPPFIVETAKQRLQASAQLIGSMVEAKQAEQQRELMEVQLRQAQKMDAVGRLAGGVAHDFNNMLSVILGYTDIAMTKLTPSDHLYEDLQEIEIAAKRSADLTRQLLAFSRNQTIAPVVLDINNALNSMLNMLRRLIGENIGLVWEPGAAPLWVRMDPSQVNQILVNLSVNAKDALSGGGSITISTSSCELTESQGEYHTVFVPGKYILIQVSDDGCGMDEETMTNLFEPFFTTKAVGQGTGLGLATVYGIVKQNNGMISVHSKQAEGTSFKIYIPQYEGPISANETTHPKQPDVIGKETVLIVEDEMSVLLLTESILRRFGYTVLVASRPQEAISIAEHHPAEINLLLSDMVMPDMNGPELSKRIHAIRPSIKTVFMSGYAATVLATNGEIGQDSRFLSKPFTSDQLAQTVRDALTGVGRTS